MSDSDNPENKPDNGNSKGVFGWRKPPEGPVKPLSDPDPNYSAEAPGDSDKTDQEALFEATAIEYYNKGQEIIDLIKEKGPSKYINLLPEDYRGGIVMCGFFPEYVAGGGEKPIFKFASNIEPISGHDERDATPYLIFYHDPNRFRSRGEKDRFDTNFSLSIDFNWSTSQTLGKPFRTDYRFNERGEFAKENYFDLKGEGVRREEPEMEAGDFELAGQALELIKKRIIDPMWDQEEPTSP